MTFCLWHIPWLSWELSLESPKSFWYPVCLTFRFLTSTFLIRDPLHFMYTINSFLVGSSIPVGLYFGIDALRDSFLETVLSIWHATGLSNACLRLQTAWENAVLRCKYCLASVDRWWWLIFTCPAVMCVCRHMQLRSPCTNCHLSSLQVVEKQLLPVCTAKFPCLLLIYSWCRDQCRSLLKVKRSVWG